MKKIFYSVITLLLCLTFSLFGCSDRSKNSLLPSTGTAVAEIQGTTYYYNPEYLFKLSNVVFSDNLHEKSPLGALDNKDSAIYMELAYLDALADTSISVSKTDIDKEKKYRQNTMMAEVPLADDMLQKCITSDGLKDDKSYWDKVDPYIEKYLYAFQYTEKFSNDILKDELESIDNEEEQQEVKKKVIEKYDELKKKYSVVIIK